MPDHDPILIPIACGQCGNEPAECDCAGAVEVTEETIAEVEDGA